MNLTESQLFTIEALNRIDGFVWPYHANFASMNDSGRAVDFWSSNPTLDIDGGKYTGGGLQMVNSTHTAHPDWRNSLITREQFESVDGWVRSWVASVPEITTECAIEVECGMFGKKWRYHRPQKENMMPEQVDEQQSIEQLYDEYRKACIKLDEAKETVAWSTAQRDEALSKIKSWNKDRGFDVSEF